MLFAGTLRQVTVSFPYIMSTFSVLQLHVKLPEIPVTRYGNVRNRPMSARDKNDWIRTGDEFYMGTNFPKCIRAVDGNTLG